MEQRPLRLGDVVDDYCPRERRVTNHAIVAIVGDVISQTRCTTCDTEHPFKGGREPRLRKKPPQDGLYEQVLADVTGGAPSPDAAEPAAMSAAGGGGSQPGGPDDERAAEATHEEGSNDADRTADGWLAHRQLIRATLPRTDNDPPTPRPIPEFTMHQRPARGGRGFRFFGAGNGDVNGNGPGHGAGRHGKHGRRHRGNKRPR
jgi:hypothetical protein